MKHRYQQLGLATAMRRWQTPATVSCVGCARLPGIAGIAAHSAFNRFDLLSSGNGEPMT
ncbi:MAG: hypothetical protein AAGE92_13585 [Cyanobacteria bacterium P01_G01_bin.4]